MAGLMIKKIKQLYVSLINALVSWSPPNNFTSDAEMDNILLIRLDELGDFILWLDSAKEYRAIYPNRKITLLVNEKWYDLAKSLDYWDDVIGLNTFMFKINPFYRLKYLLYIRQQGFETVLCPRYSIQYLLEPAIVATSGAENKIIFQNNFPIEKEAYWTKMIRSSYQEMHELNRNAEFVVGLGQYRFRSSVPRLNIKKHTRDYILICPSSYRKEKEWPLANYVEIMKKLYNKTQSSLVMVSNERLNCGFPSVIDYSNNKDLMRFIELIANAKLVIANDSSAIHIASALDVPSLCIGVGKHGRRFVPYEFDTEREGQQVPKVIYNKDVKSITISEVWFALRGLI